MSGRIFLPCVSDYPPFFAIFLPLTVVVHTISAVILSCIPICPPSPPPFPPICPPSPPHFPPFAPHPPPSPPPHLPPHSPPFAPHPPPPHLPPIPPISPHFPPIPPPIPPHFPPIPPPHFPPFPPHPPPFSPIPPPFPPVFPHFSIFPIFPRRLRGLRDFGFGYPLALPQRRTDHLLCCAAPPILSSQQTPSSSPRLGQPGSFSSRVASPRGGGTLSPKAKQKKPRPVPNHQLCPQCNDLARPNVQMNPKCVPHVGAVSRGYATAWGRLW